MTMPFPDFIALKNLSASDELIEPNTGQKDTKP